MDFLPVKTLAFWLNINVYPLIVLSVFVLWVFWKKQKPALIDYLDTLNILTCCAELFFEIYYLIEFWDIYTTAGDNGFWYGMDGYAIPRWSFSLLRLLLLIGMLKKSLRRNFAYSFLYGAIISVEVFLILITNMYADFLPSTLFFRFEHVQSFLLYGLIAFGLFLIRKKWSRGH